MKGKSIVFCSEKNIFTFDIESGQLLGEIDLERILDEYFKPCDFTYLSGFDLDCNSGLDFFETKPRNLNLILAHSETMLQITSGKILLFSSLLWRDFAETFFDAKEICSFHCTRDFEISIGFIASSNNLATRRDKKILKTLTNSIKREYQKVCLRSKLSLKKISNFSHLIGDCVASEDKLFALIESTVRELDELSKGTRNIFNPILSQLSDKNPSLSPIVSIVTEMLLNPKNSLAKGYFEGQFQNFQKYKNLSLAVYSKCLTLLSEIESVSTELALIYSRLRGQFDWSFAEDGFDCQQALIATKNSAITLKELSEMCKNLFAEIKEQNTNFSFFISFLIKTTSAQDLDCQETKSILSFAKSLDQNSLLKYTNSLSEYSLPNLSKKIFANSQLIQKHFAFSLTNSFQIISKRVLFPLENGDFDIFVSNCFDIAENEEIIALNLKQLQKSCF